MSIISFSEIGNLGNYRLEHQRVKNYGLLVTPKLVLKLYQMTTQRYFEPEKMEVTKSFLEKEIKRRAITNLTGAGFAIQSKDMLNVVRWDTEFPILMKNVLYGFKEPTLENVTKKEYNGMLDTAEKLNINKVGPFCIWEDTIVAHERTEWIKYLHSKRTEVDKRAYFSSFINGLLI